jgi:phosphoglycolate phosphatase
MSGMDVLVDLDGTLVDPKAGIIGSIQYALARLGAAVPPADSLGWAIGPPLRSTFPKLLGSSARTEEAVALYRRHYRDGAMYRVEIYAGIPTSLVDLKAAGCRLILATSKAHVFAGPILEHCGLSQYFAAVHGPELDGTRDHKVDLIAHIIETESVDPARAVMIGDRDFDMLAAAESGVRGLGVTWGYGSAAELTAAGAAALCDSPAKLAATVLGLLDPERRG